MCAPTSVFLCLCVRACVRACARAFVYVCVCVGGGGRERGGGEAGEAEREGSEIVPSTEAFHLIFTHYSMDLGDSMERDYMRYGMGLMMCSHRCKCHPAR